jgi:hypothetical protein
MSEEKNQKPVEPFVQPSPVLIQEDSVGTIKSENTDKSKKDSK